MGLYIPNITLADINNPSYHAIIVRNNHRPMLRIEDGNYTMKESYIEDFGLINNNGYRMCMVNGKKALFHRWHEFCSVVEVSSMIGGALAGQVKYTLGTVEFEDGSIEEVAPHKIRFADGLVKQEWLENASEE